VIQTGDLVVSLDTKTVEVNGARLHLTRKEYQMMELLSLRKGTTLTKEMFLNHRYGDMDEPELKIIDVFTFSGILRRSWPLIRSLGKLDETTRILDSCR
jgi:DNA-binding response OmpR family regulator